MTPDSFRKAECCGNCSHRSKYKCGGNMWGYDEGDYECSVHMKYNNGVMSALKVELTDTCDDFNR